MERRFVSLAILMIVGMAGCSRKASPQKSREVSSSLSNLQSTSSINDFTWEYPANPLGTATFRWECEEVDDGHPGAWKSLYCWEHRP